MASDEKFVSYVRDQMRGAGVVTYRRMFGEYAIYSDATVIAFVCDNQLFFKPTDAGRALLGAVVEAPPYPRAKLHFLIVDELEDPELLRELALATARALPVPRPKTAQKGSGAKSGSTQARRAATDKRRSRDQ